MDSRQFAEKVCNIISSHKGEDIVIIDVREKTDIADYYVIASGRNMTHTKSLIEYVDVEMDKEGFMPTRSEGVREGRWAVLDYGDVIVHIFNDETRLFYHLENLWGNSENIIKYNG